MNPYTPPQDETPASDEASSSTDNAGAGGRLAPRSTSTPPRRLFSPNQVFAAGFLGVPLVFSSLLATNYRRQGFSQLANLVLAFGVITTGGSLFVSPIFHILAGVFVYSAWFYSRRDEPGFEEHIARGGAQESWGRWAVLCGSMLLAFVAILVIFGGI